MPTLSSCQYARQPYVDEHMIAYWSRKTMHKGKTTMRGRIIGGSQAMISDDENGQVVFVAYYPPDIYLSVIMSYCEQVARDTGSDVFVIDRAVNSKALAFDEAGLGLLCILNDHEYDGLESFEATEVESLADGAQLY